MKFKLAITTIVASIMLFGILAMKPFSTTDPIPAKKESSIKKLEGNHFVVVELFTSQGCHSCPPADKLLSELVDEEKADDQTIFPLSFHVDYWNYLGWKDPYSQSKFSDRQRTYAQQLGSSVYTPQMVFNGVAEAVGSRPEKVLNKLKQVIGKTHQTEISVQAEIVKNEVKVMHTIPNMPANSIVNIALVERNLKDQIVRGENRGKELHHDNVVRGFKTQKASKKGSETKIKLPKDINLNNASIVAYLQNEKTLEVLGAKQIQLNR